VKLDLQGIPISTPPCAPSLPPSSGQEHRGRNTPSRPGITTNPYPKGTPPIQKKGNSSQYVTPQKCHRLKSVSTTSTRDRSVEIFIISAEARNSRSLKILIRNSRASKPQSHRRRLLVRLLDLKQEVWRCL